MKRLIKEQLEQNGYVCNAQARETIADAIQKEGIIVEPHKLDIKEWAPVIKRAIEVGGCTHGTEYSYRNAQGSTSTAKVFDLYEIPKKLVNPFLVCFSGYMPAAIYTIEAMRAYEEKYGKRLPLFATGKGGNKGLFASVFNRTKGYMVNTEAEAYMRIIEQIVPCNDIRKHQRNVADIDTKGNFGEMYQLAKSLKLKEATFILCSGQPWYTKRLLAEGMLEFGNPQYSDVKINLVVLDCPLTLDSATPEGHLSELMLGYIAASLGPLTKDTCSLEAPDFSKERYLLPGVIDADWSVFEKLITDYSNMGWPNYQELLYNVDHETAVCNIIEADLRARASFTPEAYEDAIRCDINCYLRASKEDKRKFFCRTVYLKAGFYDGHRHHTAYDKVPYLDFKSNMELYKIWSFSTWKDYENHF